MWHQLKAQKAAFAEELLRNPNDPYGAATKIFGQGTELAITAGRDWIRDIEVLNKQKELIEENGEETYLPNRAILARRVFEIGESSRCSVTERLAAFRLYADLRNFIEKPGVSIDNRTMIQNNKVMVIKDHGSDEEWEEKTRVQQAKLVEHSRD